jgi:flagellar L-ring protein precursor FlgH
MSTLRLPSSRRRLTAFAIATAGLALGACSNTLERLQNVGQTPQLSAISNPTQDPNYRPVSLPMPKADTDSRPANSLWRAGSRAFFKDQRAGVTGDILTVLIDISDKAQLSNTSARSRASTENSAINGLLGFETGLNKILPNSVDNTNMLGLDGTTTNNGAGTIDRKEAIQLKVAALVTQVLPNGNLVIQGHQEVRVNYEVRDLQITGIVRREDIASTNTISYEKIAEARIAYGGRGTITDVQQPRYGNQLIDILYPF